MAIKKENLFQNIPASLRSEFVQRIAGVKGVRIERIVSRGHSSPTGYWYDQAETEWVMLVVEMTAGDHITIPPRARHRVEWTAPNEETIWLAVFY